MKSERFLRLRKLARVWECTVALFGVYHFVLVAPRGINVMMDMVSGLLRPAEGYANGCRSVLAEGSAS